jgi:hypothetical protein
VGAGELFAELSVVVGEFFDPVVSEFQTLAPGRLAGFGSSRRPCATGPVVANGFDGRDDVGLGVDPGSCDAGGAGET